jgi:hypothetical protein
MKRIKIAALGAMLFLGIACNKDKNQMEPTTYNSSPSTPSQPYKGENGIKNEENINNNQLTRQAYGDPVVTPNPPVPTTDPSTSDPARTIVKVGNTVTQPPKNTERTIIGVRNDENIHPYQGTARTIKGVRNDEMINPYQGTARKNIIGVRNDETINPYQGASQTTTLIVLPEKAIDIMDPSPDQNPY